MQFQKYIIYANCVLNAKAIVTHISIFILKLGCSYLFIFSVHLQGGNNFMAHEHSLKLFHRNMQLAKVLNSEKIKVNKMQDSSR